MILHTLTDNAVFVEQKRVRDLAQAGAFALPYEKHLLLDSVVDLEVVNP